MAGSSREWKWWYFVIAGIGIAAYSIFEIIDHFRLRSIGGVILGLLCIAIGFWSRGVDTTEAPEEEEASPRAKRDDREELDDEEDADTAGGPKRDAKYKIPRRKD